MPIDEFDRVVAPRSIKNRARTFTANAWVKSGNDPEKARAIVRDGARAEFGSIWVTIAVAIAFQLIKWWWENRVTEPSAVFAPGEPYAPKDDEQ
jgi:hypothetical protein